MNHQDLINFVQNQKEKGYYKTPMELEQIIAILEFLKNISPKEVEIKNKIQTIKARHLLKKNIPDTQWVIEKLIPENGITIISGGPGNYKTWLMLSMAIQISAGKNFLNFKTHQSKILYIDEENGERILQRRLKKLTNNLDIEIEILASINFKLNDSEVIIRHCLANDIKIVMLDSLVRIHSRDENSSTEMNKVYEELKKFKNNGLTVIISHHNRKSGIGFGNSGDEMRGSSDILAFTDCHLSVQKNKTNGTVKITQNKLREDEEMKPFYVKILSNENQIGFEFDQFIEEKPSQVNIAKEKILELLAEKSELPRQQIITNIHNNGIGTNSIAVAIADLEKQNLIAAKSGVGREKIYFMINR